MTILLATEVVRIILDTSATITRRESWFFKHFLMCFLKIYTHCHVMCVYFKETKFSNRDFSVKKQDFWKNLKFFSCRNLWIIQKWREWESEQYTKNGRELFFVPPPSARSLSNRIHIYIYFKIIFTFFGLTSF